MGFSSPIFWTVITHKNLIWAGKKKHLSLSFSSTKTHVRTKKIVVGHLQDVVSCCRFESLFQDFFYKKTQYNRFNFLYVFIGVINANKIFIYYI